MIAILSTLVSLLSFRVRSPPASSFLRCVAEERVFHAQRAFFTHMGLKALI
jgi:hypothetical protein